MSSNIKVKRICVYCSSEFVAQTTSTKYCSKKCNSAHYKAKVRAKKVERSNIETTQKKHKTIQDVQAKEFLSVKDVSFLLGCSVRSTYRLIDNGTLKAVNLAERMTRINRTEVDKLLKQSDPQPILKEPKQIQIDIADCYNMTEIQKKYGVSEKALHDIIKRNDIPKIKKGWYAYVPKQIIDELLT